MKGIWVHSSTSGRELLIYATTFCREGNVIYAGIAGHCGYCIKEFPTEHMSQWILQNICNMAHGGQHDYVSVKGLMDLYTTGGYGEEGAYHDYRD